MGDVLGGWESLRDGGERQRRRRCRRRGRGSVCLRGLRGGLKRWRGLGGEGGFGWQRGWRCGIVWRRG